MGVKKMTKKKYNYFENEEGMFECGHCGKEYKSSRGARGHCKKNHYESDKPKEEDNNKPEVVLERIQTSSMSRNKKIEAVQRAVQEFNRAKKSLSRRLENVSYESDAKYVALLGISDIHYGNANVNMEYVERLLDFVKNNERAYCFLNGDILDNWVEISPKGGHYEQTVNPSLQKEIMVHKLEPIKDKIIAIVTGNHEARSSKAGEINPTEQMAIELGIPYLGAGGRINLKLNDNEYKLHIRHKYQYNSTFNPCHACGRLIEQLDSEADIVCIGHHHDPAVEVRFKAGKQRSLLRFGSSMPSTMYSESLGFDKTPLKAPTLVLSGEEFMHHPFMDISVVQEYIDKKKGGE